MRIRIFILLGAAIMATIGILLFAHSRLSITKQLIGEKISTQSNQNSILEVIAFLPNASDIVQIQKIRDKLFWVLRDVNLCMAGTCSSHRYESWLVHTDTRTATLGQARERFNDFRVTAVRPSGSSFFEVHHEEPSWDEAIDYYDIQTGALVISTNWDHYFYLERGNTLDITKDGKTVEVSFAPPLHFTADPKNPTECSKTYRVTVDALLINGKQFKFKKPHLLDYQPIGWHGECLGWEYPDFGRPVFDGRAVSFDLPWKEQVVIDAARLDPAGVSIKMRP